MFVSADTTISLLKNVPLNNTYKDTVLFSSESEQASTFSNYVSRYWSDGTYVDYTKGYADVPVSAGEIYDCNYIRFKSKPLSQKWFYGFITEIEYVSPEASRVHFEIDVMQTWMFDFKLRPCFVERQHAKNDAIGANVVPEPFSFGDDEFVRYSLGDFIHGTVGILIGFTLTVGERKAPKVVYINDQPVVVDLYVFRSFMQFSDFYKDLNETSINNIAFITTCDLSMFGEKSGHITTDVSNLDNFTAAVPYSDVYKPHGSYTPVNNKCYCRYYCRLVIVSDSQEQKYYRERNNSNETKFGFRYVSDVGATPSWLLWCDTYTDLNKTVMYKTFPSIAYSSSMTSINDKIASANNDLSMVMGGMGGNISSIPFNIATNVMNQSMGDYARGLSASGSMHTGSSGFGRFLAGTRSLPYENNHSPMSRFKAYAEVINDNLLHYIDDYFTRYGYQLNRIVTPNINSRPQWNFVKTADASITGSIPAQDMLKICSVHDSGITYWHNIANVGNYSLSNK